MSILSRLLNLLSNLIGTSLPPEVTPTPVPDPIPPAGGWGYQDELLRLHNEYRAKKIRTSLRLDPRLEAAASKYAGLMASLRQMGHEIDGTNFVSRAKAEGYATPSAENVAMGYVTPQAVFNGWCNSPGHNRNILSASLDVGFGFARDSRGTQYWCAVFGWGPQNIQTIIVHVDPLVHPGIKTTSRDKIVNRGAKTVTVWTEED